MIAAILCFPQWTRACSCPPGRLDASTFQLLLDRADVVFLGRIAESKATPTFIEFQGNRLGTLGTIDAAFMVEKVYKWQKADRTPSVIVRTVDQGGACGFDEWAKPDSAELWLVFGTYAQPLMMPGNLPEGTLTALLCSGTGHLDSVRLLFDYLESVAPGSTAWD
jgi:hypothetical protein